jgi:DNA polymerase-4
MRVILHADMDAFYASIEQRDHPELRGRPVIVGGTGPRGVVSAASYEARRFGVHSAQPTGLARRLCPDGAFIPGDMAKYTRESSRIFEIFERFTPLVEGLSLDEAFLDITGTGRLFGPPRALAQRLRAEVQDACGLACSVGIAPVKLVAKIASDVAKPDGLLEVPAEAVREFLAPLPVGRIWGVGPVAQARLEAAGLRSVGELAAAEPAHLEALLGDWGPAVARLARGEDLREVEPWREPVSYSEENTFAEDVGEREVLERTLRAHAEAVARRLRRDSLRARAVVLKLKLGRRRSAGPRGYPILTRRETFATATDDGAAIAEVASRLLARAGLREPVRLLGVGATGLVPAADAQLSLFGPPDTLVRRDRLNRALDALRERFGPGAVVRGTLRDVDRAGLSLQRKRGESDETSG